MGFRNVLSVTSIRLQPMGLGQYAYGPYLMDDYFDIFVVNSNKGQIIRWKILLSCIVAACVILIVISRIQCR